MKQITDDLADDLEIILERVLHLFERQDYWSNETEIVMDELRDVIKNYNAEVQEEDIRDVFPYQG